MSFVKLIPSDKKNNYDDQRFYIDVEFPDFGTVRALVDTGAFGSTLSSSFFEKIKEDLVITSVENKYVQYFNKTEMTKIQTFNIDFIIQTSDGNISLKQFKMKNLDKAYVDQAYDMLLGYDFLSNYNIYIYDNNFYIQNIKYNRKHLHRGFKNLYCTNILSSYFGTWNNNVIFVIFDSGSFSQASILHNMLKTLEPDLIDIPKIFTKTIKLFDKEYTLDFTVQPEATDQMTQNRPIEIIIGIEFIHIYGLLALQKGTRITNNLNLDIKF